MRDAGEHAACVDDWLARSAAGLSSELLLRLFQGAFDVLWARTKTTLGEVTLTAIFERVLHNASEKFPFFSCLKVEPNAGIQCSELRERVGFVHDAELMEGMRFVLVEFLTVLGNLTAEILTPELHAELANLALPESLRVEQEAESALNADIGRGKRS